MGGGDSLPLHPSEQPQEHSRFTVSSGHLCYGDLHSISYGSISLVQSFPPPAPEQSGTVIAHRLEPCIPALNGTWITYHLVSLADQGVTAQFVCHFSVDPESEIQKILKVSGSPYEGYSGSNVNNDNTAREGVMVINRYDWGWYDKRGKKEFGLPEDHIVYPPHSVGLVDREVAKEQALRWKDQGVEERDQIEGGAWLFIPHAEYLFGRFGFDDEHAAARSFLFFTNTTDFMRTAFLGVSRSLRKKETPEEMFTRALNEGEQFDGLEIVQRGSMLTKPPPESECIGPFVSSEHLLEESDWDALREYAEVREITQVRTFAEPLREAILELLDNLALALLTRFVKPLSFSTSIQEFADALCPKHAENGTMDFHCYPYLIEVKEKTIPGFDVSRVESRLKGFLFRHCGEHALLYDSNFMAGIQQYMVYVLTELLEEAGSIAIGCHHTHIVPIDIRGAVLYDLQLLLLFKFCKMFWYGRG